MEMVGRAGCKEMQVCEPCCLLENGIKAKLCISYIDFPSVSWIFKKKKKAGRMETCQNELLMKSYFTLPSSLRKESTSFAMI